MRFRLLIGPLLFAVMTGILHVINPVVAEAAIARCEVTAKEPRRATPTDPEAYIEGTLTCERAILPERFTHTICLQAKKGTRYVDVHCCRLLGSRVSTTPWLMCGEPGRLLPGTHRYRTRASTVRQSNGNRETDYSTTRRFTS
jgi:hypothetical protein